MGKDQPTTPKRFKVTAVSYLNTKPFLYGIFKSGFNQFIDLQLDIPSECARKIASGEADFGLAPVAVIPQIPAANIISDYCIGAIGPVKSVCIFSEKPLEELTGIYLDYHSRTSVELAKILLHRHWRLSPALLPATPGFEKKIGDKTGGLVIGDRAIVLEKEFPYRYDLGEAWMDYTELPFVFAAWVSNKPLEEGFVQKLNKALQLGVEEIPQLLYLLPTPQPGFDMRKYFVENISYELDVAKRRGLDRFLSEMTSQQVVAPHTERYLVAE